MAIISITVKDWSISATRYNILVLLSVFAVYLYRDIWPLATFTEHPKDLHEGYLLWVKFSITTFTAVIIPLFIPRKYVAIDPKVQYTIPLTPFPILILKNTIASDARTKPRTDMLIICLSILHISRPSYNARLSRSTLASRSTPSSFRFGLLPTYHQGCLSGISSFSKQFNACTELEV